MAFSKRDYTRAAQMLRSNLLIVSPEQKNYWPTEQDKYKMALFMRDYFLAQDRFFDGDAFLRACGF